MKKIIFLLIFSFVIFNCNKDDGGDEPCIIYSAHISDNSDECDCALPQCGRGYNLAEDEYIRLLNIFENSSDACIYVQGESWTEVSFEGYLNKIRIVDCYGNPLNELH